MILPQKLAPKKLGTTIALVIDKFPTREVGMKNTKIPWLNDDGTKKSDTEVSKLGESWSPDTWNSYLDSELGSLKDEELIFVPDMNSELMSQGFHLLNFLREHRQYVVIKDAFELSLNELSKAERWVIKKLFWENVSTRELADDLKTSTGNIRVIKSRAIQKLKKIIPSQEFKQKIKRHRIQEKQAIA
jgi:RNA polymerase sigma factor (sigma-70 family)